MEFVKGKPYFCDNGTKIKQYPYLNKNTNCDVLIVGGGINGIIANYYISQKYKTVLVEKSRLAMNCTCIATALLEYQLDDYAYNLERFLNSEKIVNSYKMGQDALKELEKLNEILGDTFEFKKVDSILFSQNNSDYDNNYKEFKFRQDNGFAVKFLEQSNNPFEFKINSGIVSIDGGATLNPYLFCKQLIENSKNQDNIFENTQAISVAKTKNGFAVKTNYGEIITCKKIIASTGYDFSLFCTEKICNKFITYTIVTSPIKNFGWFKNAILKDCCEPYHYIRLTTDNRIMLGGEDTVFDGDFIEAKLALKKYLQLEKYLYKLFPKLKNQITIDYKFCGIYASTSNNLGVIGESKIDNIYYFYGVGANGILNSIYGAKMIFELFKNKETKLSKDFSPKRKLP